MVQFILEQTPADGIVRHPYPGSEVLVPPAIKRLLMNTKTLDGATRRLWVVGFLLLLLAGCAELPSWVPFQGPRGDTVAGVVTPSQKMKQLKLLQLDAPENGPEMKQQVVEYLSQTIRKEPDPLVRSEIIRTLGYYPLPGSTPVLKAALNDPDTDVRLAACEAWGKRGDSDAAELLAEVVQQDRNKEVRFAAARGLSHTRDPRAIQALGLLLDEDDIALQYRAVMALKEVTGQDLGNNAQKWSEFVKSGQAKPIGYPESNIAAGQNTPGQNNEQKKNVLNRVNRG